MGVEKAKGREERKRERERERERDPHPFREGKAKIGLPKTCFSKKE